MIKQFIVVDSSTDEYKNKMFEINTQIKQTVLLPFSSKNWRCVMFDGVYVRLTNENDHIIGSLM